MGKSNRASAIFRPVRPASLLARAMAAPEPSPTRGRMLKGLEPLVRYLSGASQAGHPCVSIFLTVRNLADIGYIVGEDAVRHVCEVVGQRLLAAAPPPHVVARVAECRFSVASPLAAHAGVRLARRLARALAEPICFDKVRIHPDIGATVEELSVAATGAAEPSVATTRSSEAA